jgi:hypothetical protein
MNQIAFDRSTSRIIACSDVSSWAQGEPILGRQGKSAAFGRAHVVGGLAVWIPMHKPALALLPVSSTISTLLAPSSDFERSGR